MSKKLLLVIPVLLLAVAAGAWLFANQQVKTMVDTRMVELLASGDYRQLDYESVQLQLNGDIRMKNLYVVDLIGNEYVLEDILVTDFDYFNEVPHHLSIRASGLRFPEGLPEFGNSPNRSLNDYLENIMEQDFLPLEINYRYDYQPAAGNRLDSRFSLALPASFELVTESRMQNVSLEQLNASLAGAAGDPVRYSMLVENADIPSASMALQDLGLVDAMMAFQGEEMGLSSEQYRDQFVAQLQAAALFVPQQLRALAQEMLVKVVEFLEGDRTLRVSIAPEYDGNYQQVQREVMSALFIGNFERAVEVLNLEVETL